ncbi:3-oxoacyl-ACP synthase [Lewinella sp. IMCC34183]|uniref:3-oxoacyl-ACP synthase n=1 Tax=Lewinella sp. IMCC34183 TaxID=2248762 RepID=UPI000E23B7E1|nr:3-oxoacyl-ACP synthase [Lewinella sp. IMCC34183]
MNDPDDIKQQLHQACVADVDRRIATVRDILAGIAASRESETKSSVGDKYETGRAMLQGEEARAHAQLQQAVESRQELDGIGPERTSGRATKGSLVITDRGSYYLAVGLGKVHLDGQLYYCVSVSSPIGQVLLNRGVGETAEFNGKRLTIVAVY